MLSLHLTRAVHAAGTQAIWAKGYTELLDLMDKHKVRGEPSMQVDCYGSGEDLEEVRAAGQLCLCLVPSVPRREPFACFFAACLAFLVCRPTTCITQSCALRRDPVQGQSCDYSAGRQLSGLCSCSCCFAGRGPWTRQQSH